MRLVVGLGNPGDRYAATRHNVGWRVIARLVERWHAAPEAAPPRWRTWRSVRGGGDVALMTPLTFMNVSGEAVTEWAGGQPPAPDDVLVVTDDVYLPVGAVRLRARGSSGGHRGLESVEQALGTREFARLRIGVGAAEDAEALRTHVLEEFSETEQPAVEEAVTQAADAVECWLDRGILAAMNQFNRKVRREESET